MKNLIYGINPVAEALESGKTFDKIFVQRNASNDRIKLLIRAAHEQEIPVQMVPPEKLDRISSKPHQGVVAFLSEVQFYKLDDVIAQAYANGESPLLVMADRITDVRNFGAMARTAYAAGVHAMIIPFGNSAALNEDAVKASSGALLKVNICREKDLVKCVKELKLNGIKVVVASGQAVQYSYQTGFTVPCAIIMGSEGEGVDTTLLRHADELVRLPMIKTFDSYNVSVAMGMLLYEVMRQRNND